MSEIILIALLLFVIFALGVAIIYFSSQNNILWFTEVKTGTLKFRVKGKKIFKEGIILDLDGYKYDPIKDEIIESPGFVAEPNFFGRWLVSWYWPLVTILKFEISKERLVAGYETKSTIAEKVVEDGLIEVDHLRVTFPRPFRMMDVDLIDGTKVHILFNGVFFVRNPYKLLSKFQGDFFTTLKTAINQYVLNIVRKMTYDDFLRMNRQIDISGLNPSLLDILGLECLDLKMEDPELSAKDRALEVARQSEQTEEALGRGFVKKAEYYGKKLAIETKADADRVRQLALAEGGRYSALISALSDADLSNDVIERIINTQIESENLAKLTGNLTLLRDGNVLPTIPLGGNK